MIVLYKTRLALMIFATSVLELLWSVLRLLFSIIAIFLAWTSSVDNLAEFKKIMDKSFHDIITGPKTDNIDPDGKDQ
jgi:hypothetical protein